MDATIALVCKEESDVEAFKHLFGIPHDMTGMRYITYIRQLPIEIIEDFDKLHKLKNVLIDLEMDINRLEVNDGVILITARNHKLLISKDEIVAIAKTLLDKGTQFEHLALNEFKLEYNKSIPMNKLLWNAEQPEVFSMQDMVVVESELLVKE